MKKLSFPIVGAFLAVTILLALLTALLLLETPGHSATPPSANGNSAAAPDQTNSSLHPSPADFAATVRQHLVVLADGKFEPLNPATLSGVKYWAFYYSASWCPPCRLVTPKLVEFYKNFKPAHPNFELVFVSHDTSADAQLNYMKTDAMAWPAVAYDSIDHYSPANYCGPGIPDLVLTDENGKVLSDSFNGDTYLGTQKVVDDIKRLVH